MLNIKILVTSRVRCNILRITLKSRYSFRQKSSCNLGSKNSTWTFSQTQNFTFFWECLNPFLMFYFHRMPTTLSATAYLTSNELVIDGTFRIIINYYNSLRSRSIFFLKPFVAGYFVMLSNNAKYEDRFRCNFFFLQITLKFW